MFLISIYCAFPSILVVVVVVGVCSLLRIRTFHTHMCAKPWWYCVLYSIFLLEFFFAISFEKLTQTPHTHTCIGTQTRSRANILFCNFTFSSCQLFWDMTQEDLYYHNNLISPHTITAVAITVCTLLLVCECIVPILYFIPLDLLWWQCVSIGRYRVTISFQNSVFPSQQQ